MGLSASSGTEKGAKQEVAGASHRSQPALCDSDSPGIRTEWW